jgi:hypothetical protein
MIRPAHIALLAGLLPLMAVHVAWLVNASTGELAFCIPYWEGCMSVSRAVRSGPGLHLFRALTLPACVLLAMSWWLAARWLQHHGEKGARAVAAMRNLGIAGAAFLVLYATWLGTEGQVYAWLRRYGIVFFFGLTALAHLIFADRLWRLRVLFTGAAKRRSVICFMLLVTLEWLVGLASAFKRLFIEDPDFLERTENGLEWFFALAMSLVFIALSNLFRVSRYRFLPSIDAQGGGG